MSKEAWTAVCACTKSQVHEEKERDEKEDTENREKEMDSYDIEVRM